MASIKDVVAAMEKLAPSRLAEEWDNVGLLVGDATRSARAVMTCLTITPETIAEAIEAKADLIVAHHPLPFRPLKTITTQSHEGRLLLALIENGIAVLSAHTAFDSAERGINQGLAEGLGLLEVKPILAGENAATGRYGRLPRPLLLSELVVAVKGFLGIDGLWRVGEPSLRVSKVGLACGSAGQFWEAAARLGCEAFVTGEANFHTALAAKAKACGLLVAGHYATERFAVEALATNLGALVAGVRVWASAAERDPLEWA